MAKRTEKAQSFGRPAAGTKHDARREARQAKRLSKQARARDEEAPDAALPPSPSSLPDDREQQAEAEADSHSLLVYKDEMLDAYQDDVRYELMELVDAIKSDATTQPTEAQREALADAVAAYADLHAQRAIPADDMLRLLAGVRKKWRDTIRETEGQRGSPYGKLINWYGRELERGRRKGRDARAGDGGKGGGQGP